MAQRLAINCRCRYSLCLHPVVIDDFWDHCRSNSLEGPLCGRTYLGRRARERLNNRHLVSHEEEIPWHRIWPHGDPGVMTCNVFVLVCRPFVRETHRPQADLPPNGSVMKALKFSLLLACTCRSTNCRVAGDSRCLKARVIMLCTLGDWLIVKLII